MLTRLRRTAATGEEGSLILSMLAMIVVSGLLLVVAGTVLNGQQQTRFDRKFEQALQVAEIGHDQVISLLQSNTQATSDDLKTWLGMPAPFSAAELPTLHGATDDGGSYVTTAEPIEVAAVSDSMLLRGGSVWKIVSTGVGTDGPPRTIESELRVRPLYGLAAFGRTRLDFNGGNGAGSFDSRLSRNICVKGSTTLLVDIGTPTTAKNNTGDVAPCDHTGIGTVATNGVMRLDGNARTEVQRAEIHNAKAPWITDPLLDATGQCESQTCSLAQPSDGRLHFYREPIELPEITSCSDGEPGAEGSFNGTGTLGARKYYFSDVTLTGNTVVTGTAPTSANPTSMTVLCVSGRLNITNSQLVNFEVGSTSDGTTYYRPRQPSGFLIFLTGESNTEINIGGGSSVSAAIYAPTAAVTGGAQANIYGSLIANSIVNQGGWNFFYDQDLAAQTMNAPVTVRNWRELF